MCELLAQPALGASSTWRLCWRACTAKRFSPNRARNGKTCLCTSARAASTQHYSNATEAPQTKTAGGYVALGKFDALHVGHRALAAQAAARGSPVLLSFAGMAEVLGWEPRLPLVASCDRIRIMDLWAHHCGGQSPQEVSLEFRNVRSLSPRDFVRLLAEDLQVAGVVAGLNYRFGYKAAGDVSQLRGLCQEFGLTVDIVEPVMDKSREAESGYISDGSDAGQVSSTRVRRALHHGDVDHVAWLLGRRHRLFVSLAKVQELKGGATSSDILNNCGVCFDQTLTLGASSPLNQSPGAGSYLCRLYAVVTNESSGLNTDVDLGEAWLTVMSEHLIITLQNPVARPSLADCWMLALDL
eukprot:SM000085S23219  [mRNA]  locus=s85:142896:144610:- [translate_table: standard]